MKTTDLDFYTSKNFLATEKGQSSLSILEKDIAIDDKIKRIWTLLRIDINCKDFNIDRIIQKITNEYNVAELIRSQLEAWYKIGNPSVTQKYNAVKKIADDYELIYCFLDDAKKKLPSTLLDHSKIAKFQTMYNNMVKQASDIKKFLDKYEKLDVVNNMKEIWDLTYDFLTKSMEHERLTDVQIPRLANALKTIDEKYKKNQANGYVRDLLNYLNIWYNSSISVDFYKSWGYEKANTANQEQECEFKHKENIIEEMFSYLNKNQIAFDEKDIILDNSSPTLYIYIKGLNKTVVISNLYWVWTHIYPGKVDINEIAESSIQEVMTKHGGRRINFVGESGMDAWKKRFIDTIADCWKTQEQSTTDFHTEEPVTKTATDNIEAEKPVFHKKNENTEEIKPLFRRNPQTNVEKSPIEEKMNIFLKGKEHISIDTLNFKTEYEWLVLSIRDNVVHVLIWGTESNHVFGHFKHFDLDLLMKLKPWDNINVKLRRVYPTSVLFKPIY